MAFHDGDLQSGIALAVQTSKAVLCFVTDETDRAQMWEDLLQGTELRQQIASNAVALRIVNGSQEYSFLNSVTPIKSTPAIVVIKNGTIQENLQSSEQLEASEELETVTERLKAQFSEPRPEVAINGAHEFPASTSNASIPTPGHTSTTIPPSILTNEPVPNITAEEEGVGVRTEQVTTASSTPNTDMTIPIVRARSPARSTASATRDSVVAEPSSSTAQQNQRQDYVKMQKEREQRQREERERIKQQIKADRGERRRLDQIRKQNEATTNIEVQGDAAHKKSADVRIQVRTFDGSTLRNSFSPSASVTEDIRPWIDGAIAQKTPYSLKQILTPLPNRNIEASEEGQSLTNLGIKGSSTFVMVPVKGYVESYTGSTSTGLVGSAVSGGYNIVVGTAGALLGGVASMLGYGSTVSSQRGPIEAVTDLHGTTQATKQTRVRTMADQRAEDAKKEQKFYNGNSLNFESRKDEDDKKEK